MNAGIFAKRGKSGGKYWASFERSTNASWIKIERSRSATQLGIAGISRMRFKLPVAFRQIEVVMIDKSFRTLTKEKQTMKLTALIGLLCLAALATAQEVRFDYDRSTNFSNYKTYQWVDSATGSAPNQLMDQHIRQAIDTQLVSKGLRRVESGGDLQIAYQAAIDQEKQFDAFGTGPRWFGNGRVTSSTIEVGKLVVDLIDPARNQLVWRGFAEKTLDIKKDPDKNYKNLEKAMAKLFKNYPPASEK